MTLEALQERLEQHFTALCSERQEKNWPVFALESGLSVEERETLKLEISRVAHNPRGNVWLPWAVYAAEVGYRYVGDEYWQTFEDENAGFEYRDREFIKQCFLHFHTRFSGAKPSGRWAARFKIICWPIAHAVLPRDLQQELARVLHEARFEFSSEVFASASALGARVAAHSDGTKRRFQHFVQDTELVGHIASALLFHGRSAAAPLLLPATLERIVADLDKELGAGAWLREAQQIAHQVTVRGLGHGVGRASGQLPQPASDHPPDLEPRIFFRPAIGGGWSVFLELPDLMPLLRWEGYRETLTSARCIVEGAPTPIPGGQVLQGAVKRLDRWPAPGQPLLRFEGVSASFNGLFAVGCTLPPGPPWLFCIRSDGIAYGLGKQRLVRPGGRYLLAWPAGGAPRQQLLKEEATTCAGLSLDLLEVPAVLSLENELELERLGLGTVGTLRVWPIGVPPRTWDGEGRAAWLSSDTPLLAIEADHPLESLTLNLQGTGDMPLRLSNIDDGSPVFVELPRLPAGHFRLEVVAEKAQGQRVSAYLDIEIRSPEPWVPARPKGRLLLLDVSPTEPGLEDLLSGRVTLELHGPVGRAITPRLKFGDSSDLDSAPFERSLQSLTLPIAEATWKDSIERRILQDERTLDAADGASLGQIEFDGEDLGIITLSCSRTLTPVRWVVRRSGQDYRVRLIDDSSEVVCVHQHELGAPERVSELAIVAALRGVDAPDGGALYSASAGEQMFSVLIPGKRLRGLAGLRVAREFQERPRTRETIEGLLLLLERFAGARIVGGLLTTEFQRQLLEALHERVIEVICGASWVGVERRFKENPGSSTSLHQLQEAVAANPRQRQIVARFAAEVLPKQQPLKELVDAVEGSSRDLMGGAGHDSWIGEFQLRLATAPESVRVWAGNRLREAIETSLAVNTLTRFGRFVGLAHGVSLVQRREALPLVPGWVWV